MENITRVVYVLDKTDGDVELRVLADTIEQRDDWVLALCYNQVIGGVKTEYLKAFYLEVNN